MASPRHDVQLLGLSRGRVESQRLAVIDESVLSGSDDEQPTRGDVRDPIDRRQQPRPRTHARRGHDQSRPEPGERVMPLPHAICDRVVQLGIRCIRHHGRHRQVRCGQDGNRRAHAHAHQRDWPHPATLEQAHGRRDIVTFRGTQGDVRVAAGAVAAEVELEHVIVLPQPRDER